MDVTAIGSARTPYLTKFGVPRQAGLCDAVRGELSVDTSLLSGADGGVSPAYDGLRSLGAGSWVWVLWGFDKNARATAEHFSPTVRPPRLGGNERLGVFATRSSFRPNNLALSALRVTGDVEPAGDPTGGCDPTDSCGPTDASDPDCARSPDRGPLLRIPVAGPDMVDGTPLYAVWPYGASRDAVPDARGGWVADRDFEALHVELADGATLDAVAEPEREGLLQVLACDPRPAYTRSAPSGTDREFWLAYAGAIVRFTVTGETLTVTRARALTAPELTELRETGSLSHI